MKNYIIYNGLHSIEDMNVLIDTLSIPSINEAIENIDVEGRNGSLTIRYGNYLDRIIPFKFTLIREKVFLFEKDNDEKRVPYEA